MDNKFGKDEIIFVIMIVINAGIAFFIRSKFGIGSKFVFFLLFAIEFGIFCAVKRITNKSENEKLSMNENEGKEEIQMYSSMQERFKIISDYCNQLEDAGYDTYKIFPPISRDEIENWEKENQVILPKGYKKWLLLSDGFDRIGNNVLYPLEGICKYPDKEYEEYYIIGSYIGDGSLLLTDKNGTFYKLDHVFGLKAVPFEAFLDDDVIECLEDGMREMELL
ncbi:MAG: SMI1/KNR4 family protein [Lachnospiraceae bacterium]|nr:SMI1/KNR4 family protein [Lachnospiraceae bacterium]